MSNVRRWLRSWHAACYRERAMRRLRGVRPATTVAVLAAGLAACASFPDALIRRASHEFECDPIRINAIERADIGYEVYDIEACGQRARYTCTGGHRHEPYHCVHEPDPRRWDPDPALAAIIPSSAATSAPPAGVGQRRRVCGTDDNECAFKQGGVWHWRPRPVSISGNSSLSP